MSRPLRALAFLMQFATLGLAAAFVITRLFPERFEQAAPTAHASIQPGTGPFSYSDAVGRAAPSVVNIYTRKVVTAQPYRIFGDPMLQRYSGITLLPPQRRLSQSLGSGVIVRDDGYILTNNHVIADADGILVGLRDGRVTPARVIGSDRETDLAVLKIEGANFPAAEFANEQPLAVGDVVLAIGNPFGIGQTVTQGIISATGRNQLNLSRFEDFIQTDAAINLGNSGGALVNARGELVGVNTAMFGQGQGISFAIPAPAASRVLAQIIEHGYVIRGSIGADYTAAPPRPSDPGAPRGVQLQLVVPGGPADLAGLQAGDLLLRFNGMGLEDEGDLRAAESALAPGSKAVIEGQRAGVPLQVEVTLVQRRGPQPQRG